MITPEGPTAIVGSITRPDAPTVSATENSRSHSAGDEAVVPIDTSSADSGSAADAWPLYPTDPLLIGSYRLVSRLGAGGMADVFGALTTTGGLVAIKLLRRTTGASAACEREYQLARAVAANCTAPVLGHGVSASGAYLVVAHLPGYRCATTLAVGAMPAGRTWALGLALATVLGSLHSRSIVHCDIKPANLLIRGYDIRVIDFGIARYVGERFGDGGIVQCSRGWAAPEQLRIGRAATPAADIFAWGCVLAYFSTGVHPFASHGVEEWIFRVQTTQPDLFGLPTGLDEIIRWALARDPKDRPSADDLANICRTALDQATTRSG